MPNVSSKNIFQLDFENQLLNKTRNNIAKIRNKKEFE